MTRICHIYPYMLIYVAIHSHMSSYRDIDGRMLGQVYVYIDIDDRILQLK